MKNKFTLKTQGPVYKVNMPNFDFAQAELEKKYVEETCRINEEKNKDQYQKQKNMLVSLDKQPLKLNLERNGLQTDREQKEVRLTDEFAGTMTTRNKKFNKTHLNQCINISHDKIQTVINLHKYQENLIKEERKIDYSGYINQMISGKNNLEEFQENGLHSTKSLVNYDVWEQQISNQELFDQLKDLPIPHGKSPVYHNKTYVWLDVEVLNYDKANDKFLVRVLTNGQEKQIGKLSILFKNEDKTLYYQRLNLAKNLQMNAQDSLRFLNYIQNIPQSEIKPISQQIKDRIIQKSLLKGTETQQVQRLIQSLIQGVNDDYELFMKKCLVLKEMLNDQTKEKFQQLRIKVRKPKKSIPYFGTINGEITQFNYKLKNYQEILQKIHISKQKTVIKTLNAIQLRGFNYSQNYIFNTKLNEHQLPMDLSAFENLQKNYHKEYSQALQMQWREYLVSEIQDSLRDTYRFYLTDQKAYQESDLQKLLTRIDFMVSTYCRQSIFKGNITNWCDFIKHFIEPNGEQQWIRNNYPVININLMVKDQQNQKKKGNHDNTKEAYLYYEPSFQKIIEVFKEPIHLINETVRSFSIMEKDLVPLIDINKKSVFQVETEQQFQDDALKDIKQYCDIGMIIPQQILDDFLKFQYLFEKNQKNMLKQLFGEQKERTIIDNLPKELVQQELTDYTKAKNEIQKLAISQKNCGFFLVNTTVAKDGLIAKVNEMIKMILDKVADICTDNITRIQDDYLEMHSKITTYPKNEQELFILKSFISQHENNIKKNEKSIKCIENFLYLLAEFCYQYPEQNMDMYWGLKNWPYEIKTAVFDGNKASQSQEIKFQDALEQEKEKFNKELVFLNNQFQIVRKFDNYANVKEYAIETNHLKDQIEKAIDQVKSFNEREILFKQPQSEYHDLNELQKDFEPYNKLWDLAIEYDLDKQEWYNGPFLKLNFSQTEKKIDTYLKSTVKIIKQFTELEEDNAVKIATHLKEDVESFKTNLWLIELLTTEVMVKKPMYWKEVFQKCNIQPIEPNDDMSLRVLTDQGMFNHREEIEDISKRVEKQYSLEKKMNEMVDNLKEIKLGITKYKTTFILQSLEEIIQQLDDNFNILIFMKSSPYIKPILKRANDLEQRLMIIQDTLEGWMKCQRSWMYLEPIFASDDIIKKMPIEHKKFENVDRFFRANMQLFNKDPQLWDGIDSDKLKNDFEFNNKTLDTIQKRLSEYLETKRRAFPRFFFLSDDQLLEILAQTKDPTLVQRHVNKCFEAINLLQFTEKEEVIGMISPEKEIVPFCKKIDVNDGDKKGNVEKWLLEIENVMRETLKQIAKKSMEDKDIRTKWVLKYPAMTTLMGDMMNWTHNSETALNLAGTQSDALEKHCEILNSELQDIVALVRSDLSELDRMTLGAMVVLDVHNRDVIVNLIKENIKSVNEFSWLSQLRYYSEMKKSDYIVICKCINAIQYYGFEYLGNSTRLVITPLTDRCYRTLMGAYYLFYGGAPEGPAGTGKTETTKDLAKAIAVQCVVFNCSDQLNFQAMSKFFKGLASSGAWCCFDEFNRIDLEVLSVVAQQVVTIQNAVKEKKKRFLFDGEDIDLIPTCTVNITMNPGYAGRSELPDNLKALFRTVAMMVPDYKLISEIFLYSVGFQDARNLARKIVSSLNLSSEQLSSQYHYDFGMRGLKAILTAAGDLKRKLDYAEDNLILIAIMDVNIPKFTINDIPLFKSITSDLFPGITLPEREYTQLLDAIRQVCEENCWIAEKEFLEKCIQLYDTIMVRHGLMVVGESTSGKTVIIESLKLAMTKLNGSSGFNRVNTNKLNPKSILSHQLYGLFDMDTKSWTDGILPRIMRELSANGEIQQREWIVFDGPVDAVWIENMNTVLDDNKKLCLTSGEIIKLTKWMTMMFEVEDLQHASPATVSRCGMVFLEAKNLSWLAILKSFFLTNFPKSLEAQQDFTMNIFKYYCDTCFTFLKKYGKFPMQYSEISVTQSLLKIFQYYMQSFEEEGCKVPKDIEQIISDVTLMSVIWSIGAVLEEPSRPKFHQFILDLVKGEDLQKNYSLDMSYEYAPQALTVKLQDSTNIYDHCYDKTKLQWFNWMQTVPTFKIPQGGKLTDLIIPTTDSVRNNYLFTLFIQMKSHLLLTGPTGTGKTVNVINEININYHNEQFTNLITAFSGQTNCNQIQRGIETKMNTKRRTRRFGPEDRKPRIVIFIDDLNMPAKEKYMAQPPIEILRQWMDEGGWYDLDSLEFKYLEDITFVAAMGPPSQGRNSISLRYSRHYNLIYVEPFLPNSLQQIFCNIMQWFFMNSGKDMSKSCSTLSDKIVISTIQIYNTIKSSKELLPTPTKSHYIYNLRDISKVFQGIARINHNGCRDDVEFIKVWSHEVKRVFQDRLINQIDQIFFESQLKSIMKSNFNKEWSDIVTVEPLLWTSFVPTVYPGGDTSKRLMMDVYCELNDLDNLKKICNEQLTDFNQMFSGNRMELVLFMNAIEHIIRIVRIITTPLGHALLVGVGGSGRKSLTTLSTFIATYDLMQVDAKNWIEELQKLLKVVGLEQKPMVFLFNDTQVQNESMYEDICNLLNNGEVPNLFPLEEKAKIVEEVSNFMPVGTMNQKYAYFVSKCKENLHLVLCMSPVGDGFRRRIRTFPGLVNCTTLDWFLPWPEEALRSTAQTAVQTCEVQGKDQEDIDIIKNGIVDICVDMQMRVKKLTEQMFSEFRRYYYVTPTSYLELLATFKKLHGERTSMVFTQITRYENGLEKLRTTEEAVQVMQVKLEELQPILEQKTAENAVMLVTLQANQKDASEQKAVCQEEERITNIQKKEANELRDSCENDLARVLPLLEEASKALEKIKQEDITTIKSFKTPPVVVEIVLQAVIIALGDDGLVKWIPKDPTDPSKGKEQDFWGYAKSTILGIKLIPKIQSYKEDKIKNMNPKSIARMKQICELPTFSKESVFKVSEPAGNLSMWIRACVETYDALLIVEPKRKQLGQAQEELKVAEAKLAEKQSQLKGVLDLLQKLEDEYNAARKEKEDLEASVDKCAKQLERATQLINGLAGEKINWGKKAKEFRESLKSITGDIILSSGIIAYLGAFMMGYRDSCIKAWQNLLDEKQILFTDNYSLQDVLTDANTIGIWVNQQKLPNDKFSIENAIILKNSTRWSLLVDPQLQANQWIRELAGKNDIKVLRQNMPPNEVMFQLENAISFGNQVLLENIGEDIDPLFEAVLQNKKIKQGGQWRLKMGEKVIDFSPDFRFYMTTKLANPHYPPEICVKVTLLNFMVTPEGLEDQMLNIVVKIEEPNKEEQRQKNVKEFFENKNKQQATENKILKMLSEASGNILDDEELINTLQVSKIESNEIEEKLKQQVINQEQFKTLQNTFKDVAKRSSNLYFAVVDLANIEPVYQFSLEFYIDLFERSVEKVVATKFERVKMINVMFTQMLFQNIIRSLLEKDKLTFSILIAVRIMQEEKKIITPQEVRYLMVGGTAITAKRPIPGENWINEKQWGNIIELSELVPAFKGLDYDFEENHEKWKNVYLSQDPYLVQEAQWPADWVKQLNSFQRLLIIRIIRVDKLIPAIQNMIMDQMDKSYIEFPPFDLQSAFDDSTQFKPLIFVLSTGADPRVEVETLASKLSMNSKLVIKSLGQGQGQSACDAIQDGIENGKWVFLQNCHLAATFMPKLESLFENIPEGCNKDFRMWLTTAPSKVFPVTILQKGVKLTYEPPKGIKNSLIRSYLSFDSRKFEDCQKPGAWKKMLFGLSFFHALILERRKFGPLGWNIPYEFSAADLAISVLQLKIFLDEYEEIQYKALNYMVAEANYGGRVTDDKDRRLIKIILESLYCPESLDDSYRYSESGIYYCPPEGHFEDYKNFIKELPLNDKPEVFGLNDNAQISAAINDSLKQCEVILSLLPRSAGGGGVSAEDMIKEKCEQILEQIPKPFDLDEINKKFPILYKQSMNTVLQQELIRYNKMLSTVIRTLDSLKKAIDGIVSMTNELDEVFNSIFDNKVAETWTKVAYPSLKPLGSWILDFLKRLNFMQTWIDNGAPTSFWISGFYFTQSFFTGVLQNFARKFQIPIDTLTFDFLPISQDKTNVNESPEDGCYIYGLFLDGCKFNEQTQQLDEQDPKVLYCNMSYIQFIPMTTAQLEDNTDIRYQCPVYKTSQRKGTLSTTGHSTNFVLFIYLPISPNNTPQYWTKRGVAMLTQLDD